jgi:flavorubredoxin
VETVLDEIGDRIFRISTFVPFIGPDGFTFNQFLVEAEEPLLFHCGMRSIFPAVREAVARVMPPERLRWVSFGHVEADESGSMNQWLAAAPQAKVVHGQVGCDVSLNDLADRPPHALAEGEVLELGGRRVRLLNTPHVPHNWEAIVLFEEQTGTLLCGDIFSSMGRGPALVREDPVERAMAAEELFPGGTALAVTTPATLRRLAALEPRRLAIMHGSSFEGRGRAALESLASAYEGMIRRQSPGAV